MEKYLQILTDSLKKKSDILSLLMAESNHQAEIISAEEKDLEAFNQSVDKKGELIEEIEKLDDGFENLFERIKEGLEADREKYKEQIRIIQRLISEVSEKSSALMALEERNRQTVTNAFAQENKRIKQQRISSQAVTNYYTNMNKINYIDPQLMDHKK